jgi:hypothetical protein
MVFTSSIQKLECTVAISQQKMIRLQDQWNAPRMPRVRGELGLGVGVVRGKVRGELGINLRGRVRL